MLYVLCFIVGAAATMCGFFYANKARYERPSEAPGELTKEEEEAMNSLYKQWLNYLNYEGRKQK